MSGLPSFHRGHVSSSMDRPTAGVRQQHVIIPPQHGQEAVYYQSGERKINYENKNYEKNKYVNMNNGTINNEINKHFNGKINNEIRKHFNRSPDEGLYNGGQSYFTSTQNSDILENKNGNKNGNKYENK
eukprot:Trichotokara_eunicae@DN3601_c0_g1_i2.p1